MIEITKQQAQLAVSLLKAGEQSMRAMMVVGAATAPGLGGSALADEMNTLRVCADAAARLGEQLEEKLLAL